MKLAPLLLRAAIRLYPAPWRTRLADDYHATVLARWSDARARGRAAWLAAVLFTIADTALSGASVRFHTPSSGSLQMSTLPAACARHLRHAWRALRHARAFTVMATLTLAVGVGAASAAFTALDAAVLEPLPYATGTRLAVLAETRRGSEISVSYPDYADWKASASAFETLGAFRGVTVTLTGAGAPERAAGQVITSDLFPVLAARPILGRAFGPLDDRRGAPKQVILTHGLWQRRFAEDPAAIGKPLLIDGEAWEVAGVMPPGFAFPDGVVYGAADLYLSAGATWIDDFDNRDSHPGLAVIGLLQSGVTLAAARQEMDAIAHSLARQYPASNAEIGVTVVDGVTALVGDLRGQLAGVTGAALVLLGIACANVAGLTLTRAISRRREFLVRLALGESQASLAGSLVAEHLMLGVAGAAGGILIAFGLTAAARPLVTRLPRLEGLAPDLSMVGFVAAAMLATIVATAAAPMFWLRKARPGSLGQRGQSAQGVRVRQLLVGAQFALAVMLLATALLFVSSFRRLAAQSGGIDPAGSLSVQIALPEATYPEARRVAFFESLFERLAAHPGVSAAGGISTLPFSGAGAQSRFTTVDDPSMEPMRTDVAAVTPGYFAAMGVPILRGRAFAATDTSRSRPVAVIDERFAERMWPGEDPIGKRVSGWGFEDLEIVGVSRHVKNYGVQAVSREELFVPHAQRPFTRMYPIVRTTRAPLDLVPDLRRLVADLDAGVVVGLPRTMSAMVDRTTAAPRLAATLSGVFGGAAMLLAAIGLYSLVSYAVALRARESAIRLALGAPPARVVRAAVGGVVAAMAAGGAAGLGGALLAGRWIESELFEVSAADPILLGATCVTTAAVGVIAAWAPARRAARTPAALTLQQEA